MSKEFQKSALPTLLHFVWVRTAFQPRMGTYLTSLVALFARHRLEQWAKAVSLSRHTENTFPWDQKQAASLELYHNFFSPALWGPFKNYVMHFSLLFDHPPIYGYGFAMILSNIYLIKFVMIIFC